MPGFGKKERLWGETKIDELFARGSSFLVFPYRVVWMINHDAECGSPVRILFSIPKKQFRKAHDRNLLRRRIRESYRQQKESLYIPLREHQSSLLVALVYIGKKILPYEQLENKMNRMLETLLHEYEKNR